MSNIEIIEWSVATQARKDIIMARSQRSLEEITPAVKQYIENVIKKGDQGILEYLQQFDRVGDKIGYFKSTEFGPDTFRVSEAQIRSAFERLSPTLLANIKNQIALSQKFHAAFVERICQSFEVEQCPGVTAGYRRVPIASAGLYVPAGKAPLPTVAQILTVAAKSAGVPRVVVCFPPVAQSAEDAIIVAAITAGADELYRVGGVAAIAALAYGTETIAPVLKIAGPGNQFVQAAKMQVTSRVGIDSYSGPSEAVILADESSNPVFLAADILARCEHGPDSAAVMITNSRRIAEETQAEVQRQRITLDRIAYIDEALRTFSSIVVVDSVDQMIALTNEYTPEHLEIQTCDPAAIFQKIQSAGSTFLGRFAPVAVGDYASGTNHCLPTGRSVGYSSAVNPEMFMKTLQYQFVSEVGLKTLLPIVESISDVEGLLAHKRSVQVRFE